MPFLLVKYTLISSYIFLYLLISSYLFSPLISSYLLLSLIISSYLLSLIISYYLFSYLIISSYHLSWLLPFLLASMPFLWLLCSFSGFYAPSLASMPFLLSPMPFLLAFMPFFLASMPSLLASMLFLWASMPSSAGRSASPGSARRNGQRYVYDVVTHQYVPDTTAVPTTYPERRRLYCDHCKRQEATCFQPELINKYPCTPKPSFPSLYPKIKIKSQVVFSLGLNRSELMRNELK